MVSSSSSSSSSSCFFLALFLAVVFFIDGANATDDLVAESCKLVPKESEEACLLTLTNEDLSVSALKQSLPALAGYSLANAADLGMNTVGKLNEMNKQLGRAEAPLKDALKECTDAYHTAVDSLIDAIGSFESKRYAEAQFFISQATFAPRTCDQKIGGGSVNGLLASAINLEFSQYLAVPLTFVTKVAGSSAASPAPAPGV